MHSSGESGLEPEEALQRTFTYHERTKHHLNRYARSAGYLDWSNQPDPFRTYTGAPRMDLPLLADAVTASYDDLDNPGSISPRRPDLNAIAILFELSLGLSAWKQYKTSRWALRCNPSSGNLHPTEGYLVTRTLPGLDGGVYHYVSRDHCLERRWMVDPGRLGSLLPAHAFLIGLSSIYWREAWKYGERGSRTCIWRCSYIGWMGSRLGFTSSSAVRRCTNAFDERLQTIAAYAHLKRE